MGLGKSLGLALAGCALLALAPVARADEEASLQDRIRDLEKTVLELKEQLGRQNEAEPLSVQVEQYLQESEKGSVWQDRNGRPLAKAIDSAWFTMHVRFRPTWSDNLFDRYDGYDDEGFTTPFRVRFGVGANLHDDISAYVEWDTYGTWGDQYSITTNDTFSALYLHQAYIDGLYAKELKMDTRIGRFELAKGDEFILGDRDFFQAGLYHDGLILSRDYEDHNFAVDFVYAKLVDGYKNTLKSEPDDSVYLFGLYGDWYGSEGTTGLPGGMQPYYLLVKNQADVAGVPGGTSRDAHTLGLYWFGDKATKDQGGLYWNMNLAGQYAGDLFWATDTRVGYTMSDTKWTPKFFGQYAYAAGDKDGAGYNPLFQDVHARYGWADQFFFSNLVVYGVGVHVTPVEGLTYGLEGRSLHLARNFSGGGDSKRLAWEYDFVVRHQYSENVDVEVVYAYVHWRSASNSSIYSPTGIPYPVSGSYSGPGADDVQVFYINISLWL